MDGIAKLAQWGLVIAGISDFQRPAEKLSLTQNGALMATGAIWTRWCMIITPRNVLYAFTSKTPFIKDTSNTWVASPPSTSSWDALVSSKSAVSSCTAVAWRDRAQRLLSRWSMRSRIRLRPLRMRRRVLLRSLLRFVF